MSGAIDIGYCDLRDMRVDKWGYSKEATGATDRYLNCGAYIEARSCERFAVLVPHLDEQLATFYGSLLRSEARHFKII